MEREEADIDRETREYINWLVSEKLMYPVSIAQACWVTVSVLLLYLDGRPLAQHGDRLRIIRWVNNRRPGQKPY